MTRGGLYAILLSLAGCSATTPVVVYQQVPEGYLQPCELPALPLSNDALSDAFAQAYLCAKLGNDDKERIRNLPRPTP